MKKLLFVMLILVSVFAGGCFNQGKESEKVQSGIESSSVKTNVDEDTEKRAVIFNSFIYAVGTDASGWLYPTSTNQPIVMSDSGTFYFCVYSNSPASLQVATIAGYSITSSVSLYRTQPYNGVYYYYYKIPTSIMKSKLRPILNHPFYVRMSTGASTKESTVRISLGY